MREDVINRLLSLGYAVSQADEWLIDFTIDRVSFAIRNDCNISDAPEGLRDAAVDMVCGRFLYDKKGTGQLDGFDVEAAVKQIKEGDTSVAYAVSDDSITLDSFISRLMGCGRAELAKYRRVAW